MSRPSEPESSSPRTAPARVDASLVLENVTLALGEAAHAPVLVRDLDLDLRAGSLVVLLGPNGSGKTTTLRLAAGLVAPTSGRVLLDGEPLDRSRGSSLRRLARRVAYVPQSYQSTFDFTVRELVAMARYPHHGRFAAPSLADRRQVEAALERLELVPLQHRIAHTLSGGELQRVQLARCLASEAHVLLLDEPTSNLDLAHGLEVLEVCRALADEGRLVVLTLHDLMAARRFADRVVLLQEGRLVDDGTPVQVLDAGNIRRVFAVEASELRSGSRSAYWFDRLQS